MAPRVLRPNGYEWLRIKGPKVDEIQTTIDETDAKFAKLAHHMEQLDAKREQIETTQAEMDRIAERLRELGREPPQR